MSNIPEARQRLSQLSEKLKADGKNSYATEIDQIIDMMHRKRIKKVKASTTSHKITPHLAYEIYNFCEKRPEISNQRVAEIFNVNQGRVTEILERGYRYYYERYTNG